MRRLPHHLKHASEADRRLSCVHGCTASVKQSMHSQRLLFVLSEALHQRCVLFPCCSAGAQSIPRRTPEEGARRAAGSGRGRGSRRGPKQSKVECQRGAGAQGGWDLESSRNRGSWEGEGGHVLVLKRAHSPNPVFKFSETMFSRFLEVITFSTINYIWIVFNQLRKQ